MQIASSPMNCIRQLTFFLKLSKVQVWGIWSNIFEWLGLSKMVSLFTHKQPLEVFYKKLFLKVSQNLQEKPFDGVTF